MLFLASGVSKWIFVPCWKAFSTWLAKQLSRLNQRMSLAVASARRGSTQVHRQGRVETKVRQALPEALPAADRRHDVKQRVIGGDREVMHHAVVGRLEP